MRKGEDFVQELCRSSNIICIRYKSNVHFKTSDTISIDFWNSHKKIFSRGVYINKLYQISYVWNVNAKEGTTTTTTTNNKAI